MNQTVVGVFRDPHDSQQAVQQLEAIGLDRDHIDHAVCGSADGTAPTPNEDGIARFFTSLFGDGADARRHTEVARQGAVVTVHAESEDEARRAALILDRYGACDFEGEQHEAPAPTGSGYDHTRRPDYGNFGTAEELPGGEIGNVRLHSRIVDRSVEEPNRLRQPAGSWMEQGSAANRPAAAPMDTPGTGLNVGNQATSSERRDNDENSTRGLVGGDSDRIDSGSSNPITGDLSDTGSSRFRQ